MDNYEKTAGGDPVAAVRELIENLGGRPDGIDAARSRLLELSRSADEASQPDLRDFITLQVKLLEIVDCTSADSSDDRSRAESLARFALDSLDVIQAGFNGDDGVAEGLAALTERALDEWGDFVDLLDDGDQDMPGDGDHAWRDGNDPSSSDGEEAESDDDHSAGDVPTVDDVKEMLSRLSRPPSVSTLGGGEDRREPRGATRAASFAPRVAATPPVATPRTFETPAGTIPRDTLVLEPTDILDASIDISNIPAELIEAYLDDAVRGVAAMEEAIFAYEADVSDLESMGQVRRELHTLKGASGSIGLAGLAGYLHEVEETVRASCEPGGPAPDVDSLFTVVDRLRKQISRLGGGGSAPGADTDEGRKVAPRSSDSSDQTPEAGDRAAANEGEDDDRPRTATQQLTIAPITETSQHEESLRVKVAQLDRLMDMLAELVMLRNRRDSGVSRLEAIQQDVTTCVSRLRTICDGEDTFRADAATQFRYFTEVANDLMDVARRIRRYSEPIAEENLTISRFIRQFRQELVELRQMPASGLFRRLQRAVRDAAMAEGKQVRMHILGEDTGIEKSLQERLFEPLMHIVRNAVSHGIEKKADRIAGKKDPVGNVTLQARSGTNLLIIEIRDDGKGLDYDALRRRGLEMGLLSADRVPQKQELAQLIFAPGFSTRSTVSQISGRGVGMDVVASALKRMRSWVEVDSTPGKGTTIRLTIPLRSVIEHTMVFRSGGRLFAVPMQFVRSAGEAATGIEAPSDEYTVRFSDLFPIPRAEHVSHEQKIVIRCVGASLANESDARADAGDDEETIGNITLLVDEIVGPEEVVLRPLPPLLKHHHLFTGATLSGGGDIMFVFDCQRLAELCLATTRRSPGPDASNDARTASSANTRRLLVVDDSMSARRSLARYLRRYGFDIVEACDGQEALGILKGQAFDAVFTDLEMPRVGGFELLREIRAGTDGNSVPVVLVTSRTEDEMRDKAKALGATAYLTKPVAEKKLVEAIGNIPSIRV